MTPQETAQRAIAQRASIRATQTNALRLIDGAGDGLPGVILEAFAEHWLISTADSRPLPPWLMPWLRDRGHTCYHKRLDQHQKESPTWLCGPEAPTSFPILETDVTYEASFTSGYSQGLFLDQRENRTEVRKRAQTSQGARILNTFSYTGAFSVCAALGGAETTTLDLSQPYLDWAKRNFTLNHLDPGAHHFCKGDTFHWLRRFAKQGRRFDGIILDPPTFSRDERGNIFRVERDYGRLMQLAADVLAPDGWMLCCTNFRKMTDTSFRRQLPPPLALRFRATTRHMPGDFTDIPYLKTLWLDAK